MTDGWTSSGMTGPPDRCRPPSRRVIPRWPSCPVRQFRALRHFTGLRSLCFTEYGVTARCYGTAAVMNGCAAMNGGAVRNGGACTDEDQSVRPPGPAGAWSSRLMVPSSCSSSSRSGPRLDLRSMTEEAECGPSSLAGCTHDWIDLGLKRHIEQFTLCIPTTINPSNVR